MTSYNFTVAGDWHWKRNFLALAYLGMIASYIVYIYYRCRYTLKIASNRKDASGAVPYKVSVYSVITLVIEILCMAAMALYAGKQTYKFPPPESCSLWLMHHKHINGDASKQQAAIIAEVFHGSIFLKSAYSSCYISYILKADQAHLGLGK